MGFFDSIFGTGDPSQAANKYMDQIPDVLKQYYNPYIQAGQQAGSGLQQQYGQLMNDPGGRLNQMGQGYQKSPGFDFAMKQALQGAGHAAAAGGMAGTPEHEQQNMELATQLGNQDYNQWIQNAMGMYGQGLQGSQGMYGIGAQAGMGLGNNLGSTLGSQGQLAYEGQNAQNQQLGGLWGSLLGGGLGAWAGGAGNRALGAFYGSGLGKNMPHYSPFGEK